MDKLSRDVDEAEKFFKSILSGKPEGVKCFLTNPRELFTEEELDILTENEKYKLLRAFDIVFMGYADQAYPNIFAVVESVLTRLCELKTGQKAEYLFRACEILKQHYEKEKGMNPFAESDVIT